MNIVERAKQFAQSLREVAGRRVWDWKRCPKCGGMETQKYGSYMRNPSFLEGRQQVKVQRHLCKPCKATYRSTRPC